MKEVKDYNPSKDPRLINCKTECGNERCFAKRFGLFAEKTCQNFMEPRLQTNADRIRAMSDEELAEWLAAHNERSAVCPNFGAHDCQASCIQCWLDWLKEEAK